MLTVHVAVCVNRCVFSLHKGITLWWRFTYIAPACGRAFHSGLGAVTAASCGKSVGRLGDHMGRRWPQGTFWLILVKQWGDVCRSQHNYFRAVPMHGSNFVSVPKECIKSRYIHSLVYLFSCILSCRGVTTKLAPIVWRYFLHYSFFFQ